MAVQKHHTMLLKSLSQTVNVLDMTFSRLMAVMDKQVQAIIASDAEKIEELTEEQSSLQGDYKQYERAFIEELEQAVSGVPGSGADSHQPSLSRLKEIFPEAAPTIARWQKQLTENAARLKQKHGQVVQLLEFALVQNANMMHSIYRLHNEKNSHYSQNGDKAGVVSGVAINHKA